LAGHTIRQFQKFIFSLIYIEDIEIIVIVITVRELMGRVCNVVLMNVYLGLENPGGSGFRVGGYMSQVREMGKLVYEQPGNEVDGSCHSKEGSK
jgi:hypothetical protein